MDFSSYQDKIDIRRVTALANPTLITRLQQDPENNPIKLFLVTNTHEGAKKVDLFDDIMAKLKTEKEYNPSMFFYVI